ncbi:hypothetical protein Tco_0862917 [Tanacetum coccineum]
MPSIGNLSNSSDDLIDPAIMVVGRGKSPSFDMRSSSSDEETKRWLLMQQQQSASTTQYHPQPQFSQTSYIQQHTSHVPQFPSSYKNYYNDLDPSRIEVGLTEQTHKNEILGFEKLVPSYSDYKFQIPVLAMYTLGYLECIGLKVSWVEVKGAQGLNKDGNQVQTTRRINTVTRPSHSQLTPSSKHSLLHKAKATASSCK